jgi:prepilin-type N-terminal cleavage/methylation domain-containing protein
MRTQQSGFTLVEIAIVLVIIGLLLGGVLKGQELINSAKSKAVISDFRNTATMIAAYQDRFRALPGDDKAATTHLTGLSSASSSSAPSSNGDGDGTIEKPWNSTTAGDESALVWQHLRLANLAAGSTASPSSGDWEPKNSEGGRIGVQSTRPKGFAVGRLFVCQGNISGRIGQQADSTMDDGSPKGGSVQAFTNTTTAGDLAETEPATTYDESSLYILCASL